MYIDNVQKYLVKYRSTNYNKTHTVYFAIS